MTHQATLLPGGDRLHLHHGPIDLIIGCATGPGDRHRAFAAAEDRFATVLAELVPELPILRRDINPQTAPPQGQIASRMVRAVRPYAPLFVTPMATVAGAVADTILEAMRAAVPLRKAYVNNGGDIALYLSGDETFAIAMSDASGTTLGTVRLSAGDGIGGIATSGRHGRSHSFGIADSVTVLARSAAEADVAATLTANAVDLPGHPGIHRQPACQLDPDSDLGERPVVTGCTQLSDPDVHRALDAGAAFADQARHAGRLNAAALFLQGRTVAVGALSTQTNRTLAHA